MRQPEDGDVLALVAGAAADRDVEAEEFGYVGGADLRAAQMIGGTLAADRKLAGLGRSRVFVHGFHLLATPLDRITRHDPGDMLPLARINPGRSGNTPSPCLE
jgi:hypothetical protein